MPIADERPMECGVRSRRPPPMPTATPCLRPYGLSPMGPLIFTPQGRMIAALCDVREGVQGDWAYNSYCGEYALSDGRLTTYVDSGAPPVRIGGRQLREVNFRDAMLVLSSVRRTGERRELHWKRISDA